VSTATDVLQRARAADLGRQQRAAARQSVLAYVGLRRGDALALSWRNVRERTILVDRVVSLGKQKGTKTNATRTVRLLATPRWLIPRGGGV
jgi:integrase